MSRVYRFCAVTVAAVAWCATCSHASAECGIASTYSSGSRTANGEIYNHMGISAAHKTLPFGSRVIVRNQRTGRSIEVRINDRGPFIAGRIIDLSTGARNALGMDGLAHVCLEVVSFGNGRVREALVAPTGHLHPKATVVRSVRGASTRVEVASVGGSRKHRVKAAVHVQRSYAYAGLYDEPAQPGSVRHRRASGRHGVRHRHGGAYARN